MPRPLPRPDERRAFLLLTAAIALAFVALVMRPLLAPLVLAALVVVVVDPLYRRLVAVLGGRRLTAAAIFTLLLVFLLGGPLVGLTLLFLDQARSALGELIGTEEAASRLVQAVRGALTGLDEVLRRTVNPGLDIQALLLTQLSRLGHELSGRVPRLLGQAGQVLFGVALSYLMIFVFLAWGKDLLELAVELSPLEPKHSRRILVRLEGTIRGVFLGGVATALLQGTVGALGFWLMGFQNYLVWGVLIAAAGLVPFVGTGLIWAPAALYLAMTGHGGAATAMLGVGAVVSTVDNLLRPFVIHEHSAIHPVLIFLGLVGAVQTLGPMGVIYGPLLIACLVEVFRIYRTDFHRPIADSPPPPETEGPEPPPAPPERPPEHPERP